MFGGGGGVDFWGREIFEFKDGGEIFPARN